MKYYYAWGNNEKRKTLKGRVCEIIQSGKMNTVLIKFFDNGQMETTSRWALRKIN